MGNDISSRILYCDASCVIVNKIAGEASEGAAKGMIDLPRLLDAELVDPRWPQPPAQDILPLPTAVHRIDVPVSGCAAFARTNTVLSFLNEAFSSGTVIKKYWAVVELPKNSTLFSDTDNNATPVELTHWIEFNPRKNKSIAYDEPGPGRKKAILRYSLAGKGTNYLFLEIDLITGRHHQIRAQLAQIGLHIKGDLKYGAKRSEPNGGIRLHARSLSFPYPVDNNNDNKRITVQADPPICDNLWQAFTASATDAASD